MIAETKLENLITTIVVEGLEREEHESVDVWIFWKQKLEGPKHPFIILKEIINVLKPSSASIFLINPDTQRLELEVSHGLAANCHKPTTFALREIRTGLFS